MSEKRQTRAADVPRWPVIDDFERCYRFMRSRDPRYDGFFFVGVTSTGIYCRPSCPARTPQRRNIRLFAAAAAQAEGFRACKRCEPDAAPGSPAWNRRADVAGRAFRLIADGIVDREGVSGLAARLGFSERQLNRILVAEVGAGPGQLARAQRAQAARADRVDRAALREVALASGLRQHPPVQRHDPGDLRAHARASCAGAPAAGAERRRPARWSCACRPPAARRRGPARLPGRRARSPGVEQVEGGTYRRSLALEHGGGLVALTPEASASAASSGSTTCAT